MRKFKIAIDKENNQLWTKNVADTLGITEKEAFDLIIPSYETYYAAGADFKCAQTVTVPSMWKNIFSKEVLKPTLVHTGIKADMEEDEVLYIFNRSSGPIKRGLILANSVGVIDKDFFENEKDDGEIKFAFYNIFPWDLKIEIGTAIGQGVFQKILRDDFIPRGGIRKGGLGSTDKN